MKIYKSDLHGFADEAKSPVYVTVTITYTGGQMPMSKMVTAVAGWNEQGHVVELRVEQEAQPYGWTDQIQHTNNKAQAVKREMVTRLEDLGFVVKDGTVSEEPVAGRLE